MSAILPLAVRGLTVRRRGTRLLGPVDLDLAAGGTIIVLGPNGSGKSTLLRTLHGVERPSEGHLEWAAAPDDVRAGQAFVFQTPILLQRSVAENLAYPLKLAGVPRADRRALARDWAGRIDLSDALDRPAPRLSGGERQKLALARALIRDPQLLFLDEPTASLDGAATLAIEALLQDAKARGVTIVMATHDLGQARRLADRVLFVRSGRIEEDGPAASTLSAPRSPALAAFLKGDIVT